MEIKKSPKANIENSRLLSILVGLVMAIGVLYAAFEWIQTDSKDALFEEHKNVAENDEIIPITDQEEEEEEPEQEEQQEEQKEKFIDDVVKIMDNDQKVESADINSEDDKDNAIVVTDVTTQVEEEEEEPVMFNKVEKLPEFPGGKEAMNRWIAKNVKYPLLAMENGIEGRVYVKFVVSKDGSIQKVSVHRSVEESLDAEAVRVVSSMPKWTPGMQGGKAVPVTYVIPIRFKIQ